MRNVILFDIDYTLFDASKYRDLLFDLIVTYIPSTDKNDVREALAQLYLSHKEKKGYFDLEYWLEEIATHFRINLDIPEVMSTILHDEAIYQKSIYNDTVEVLHKLSQDKDLVVGIFSSGREDFQRQKIEMVKHLLEKDHIHIFKIKENDLPQIIEKYHQDKLFLVDDILKILYNAKTLNSNVTTIWIQREKTQEKAVNEFTPDYTITNLEKVIPVLEREKERLKR